MKGRIKVVLVEPLYQINLGYVARTMSNFGVDKLCIVNPRCNYKGKEATKYSKHAFPILKRATIYRSIAEATKGSSLVVGTTGIWHKSNASFFNVYTLRKAKSLLRKGNVALLIGRDDTGLTKEELQGCDLTVFIPAERSYPVLNISHALAILLYELRSEELEKETELSWAYATDKQIKGVGSLFWKLIRDRDDIRDKRAVMFAFEHIVRRSTATKKELSAISIALSHKKGKEKKVK